MQRFVGVAVCGLFVAPALAAPPRAIFSEVVTSPTSDVPGVAGAKFDAFERPYNSPNGRNMVLSASTNEATAVDEVVLVRRGVFGAWQTIVKEGSAVPNGLAGENWGIVDQMMAVNDAGALALGVDTSAATTVDELVVRQNADGTWVIVSRQGDAVPGVAGAAYGTTSNSVTINSDGSVNFLAISLTGVPTTQDVYCMIEDGTDFTAREGDVSGPAAELWQFFDTDDFRAAGDANDTLIQGDNNNATTTLDDILVYNGAVVLQEGVVVPGSGFVSPITAGVTEPYLGANGDWFARGSNADGEDWLVRNGVVVATTDDPVPGGLTGETFDDTTFAACFFLTVSNAKGDYAFGAVTSNPDTNADGVIIFVPGGDYSQAFVLVRQGDGVDINGNGLADDDAFCSVFNNDDAALSLNGEYYFMADLINGAAGAIGQAFSVVDGTPSLPGDLNCDGEVTVSDIGPFVLTLTALDDYLNAFPNCDVLAGDLNGDFLVTVSDIGFFVAVLTGG